MNPGNDKVNKRRKVFLTKDKGQECERIMQMRKQMGDQCTWVKDVLQN